MSKTQKNYEIIFYFFYTFKIDFYFIMINGNKIKNRHFGLNSLSSFLNILF